MKSATKKIIESLGFRVYGNLVMVFGVLFPLPLVQGNEKLGKSVWHSSTLPTSKEITAKDADGNVITERGTCPMTCPGCYGCSGNYRFNGVKYALIMRTRLLKTYPDIYFSLVEAQIVGESIERLRIHATGDFLPGEARGFYDVLSRHPEVKAWTYTKVTYDNDIDTLNSLDNCNVVESIVPECGFNFGHIDYIIDTYNKLMEEGESVYICRCGIDKNQHCSNCDGCINHRFVLFIEHSTGYKAESDELFPDVVRIIEAQ